MPSIGWPSEVYYNFGCDLKLNSHDSGSMMLSSPRVGPKYHGRATGNNRAKMKEGVDGFKFPGITPLQYHRIECANYSHITVLFLCMNVVVCTVYPHTFKFIVNTEHHYNYHHIVFIMYSYLSECPDTLILQLCDTGWYT
jgi:hypothetical protein